MDTEDEPESRWRGLVVGRAQAGFCLAHPSFRAWLRLGGWGCIAAMSQACSPASASSDCGWLFTGKVEVMTWWQTAACSKQCQEDAYEANNEIRSPDAEANAVNVVQVAYDQCGHNPTGATPLVVTTLESPDVLRAALDGGLDDTRAESTTLVHLNAGSDVWTYAGCSETSERKLAPLGTWDTSPLTARMPPILRDKISCASDPNTFYAVPVGVHRLNVLFYNEAVLRKYSQHAEHLKDMDLAGFLEMLHAIDHGSQEGGGKAVKPIVVPGDAWPQSLLLAENVMLAAVGKEAFETFWDNNADGEIVEKAGHLPSEVTARLAELAPFVHLPDCVRESGSDCDRADALAEVKRGTAAFTVMGDWVVLDLKSAPNVGYTAFPGTQAYFVYTADVLAVPSHLSALDPNDPAYGVLKSVTSAATQQEYADAKGSRALTFDSNGRSLVYSEFELFAGFVPVPSLTLFAKTAAENTALQKRLGKVVGDAIPAQNIPVERARPTWRRSIH